MANDLFVLGLALAFAVLFRWAFRALPREEWQILASLPSHKTAAGVWRGLNVTYYGLFNAAATTLGATVAVVLLGASGAPAGGVAAVIGGVLAGSVPAAKLVARLVERKTGTLTVAGAGFTGLVVAPAAVWAANAWVGAGVPLAAALGAMAVGYALGESLGRLACISFGCCYGRPLASSRAWCRALFSRRHFAFTGPAKKAAYEGGLEREPVIPIQGITAVLYAGVGLAAMWWYLRGAALAAFVLVMTATQSWRVASEVFRADYRGRGRVSAYQIMAALSVVYAVGASSVVPPAAVRMDIADGLRLLWSPLPILLLQALWLGMLMYTGRSVVTAATISIHVVRERI